MATRLFPARTLEDALRVPETLKQFNGGQPWPTDEVAKALNVGAKSSKLYYLTAAARDYELTEGTRDSAQIALKPLGRRAVYPASPDDETQARLAAFLSVDVFKQVLEHYGGNNLPAPEYLANTLETQFKIPADQQDEFVDVFTKNCRFLGIGREFKGATSLGSGSGHVRDSVSSEGDSVTVASPADVEEGAPVCFVIMPFTERDDAHQPGFFDEVLEQVFTPAATNAGFRVMTAKRQGSDVIQSTIVNDLLKADLVLADLTEHNPNVLFELGMRMAEDKPVALVRSRGTGPIFDVDNMLRVAEYNPNLWPSTVTADVPVIEEHIRGTWENRDSVDTFMKILRKRS